MKSERHALKIAILGLEELVDDIQEVEMKTEELRVSLQWAYDFWDMPWYKKLWWKFRCMIEE